MEAEVVEDITTIFGPAWVLVSVPTIGPGSFDVVVKAGPALDMPSLRKVLSETLKALDAMEVTP